MNIGIQIGLGIAAAVGAIQVWRNADRISNSRYWFIGWAGYLLLLAFAARALSPLFDGLPPIDEDVAVPALFIGVVLLVMAMLVWKERKLRKR